MMNFYSSDNASLFFAVPEQILSETKEKATKSLLSPDIEQLYRSRDRLREFIHEMGALKYGGIRQDVLQHCNKIRINSTQNLNHEKVGKMVKNRIEKMIKNKRIKKNWSEEDVLILIWITSKYADLKGVASIERDLTLEDWNSIAELIPGVTGESCMFKWLSLRKNNLSENNWSQKESNLLDKVIKMYGDQNWPLISQELYYANNSQIKVYRCPKQCREHWNCYLNPKLKKGPWSKEQDELLLSNVRKNNGQKKWAEIVKEFNGRTENALKNRYTLIMEKQTKNHPKGKSMTELELIDEYLQRMFVQQFVNMKQENQNKQNEEQVKQKDNKKQEGNKRIPKQKKIVLRRRHSMRTLGERKVYLLDDYNENAEHTKNKIAGEHFNPQKLVSQIIQQFSEPCKHHSSSEIFYEEEYHATTDKKKQNQIQTDRDFPDSIQGIQIIPFNRDLLTSIKNFGELNFVPCILCENKFSKIDS